MTRGLTAFYLLFDARDSDNELDTDPRAFRLPSGEYDVPIVLHDRAFDQNGGQIFPVFNTDGVIGDKYTLNNAVSPYMPVKPRKYRFRFLHGGPSRFYMLALSNGQNFIQISEDGNLLPKPLSVPTITLGVANRSDVIIDFSQVPFGASIYLLNVLEQTSGRGPTWNILNPGRCKGESTVRDYSLFCRPRTTQLGHKARTAKLDKFISCRQRLRWPKCMAHKEIRGE